MLQLYRIMIHNNNNMRYMRFKRTSRMKRRLSQKYFHAEYKTTAGGVDLLNYNSQLFFTYNTLFKTNIRVFRKPKPLPEYYILSVFVESFRVPSFSPYPKPAWIHAVLSIR